MNKIYVVLKNCDFTEGRGPMILHRCYHTLKAAQNYVKSQEGICGSSQYESGYDILGKEQWNGYDIQEMKVF